MAAGVLRTAFARRDLTHVPVVVKPRSSPRSTTNVLMTQQYMLVTVDLVTNSDPDKFMSSNALGLGHTSESWWVARHGRWCSQQVERKRT